MYYLLTLALGILTGGVCALLLLMQRMRERKAQLMALEARSQRMAENERELRAPFRMTLSGIESISECNRG